MWRDKQSGNLTQEVHHGAHTGAQIIFHIAKAAPEDCKDSTEFFRELIDKMRSNWKKARRGNRTHVVVAVTKSTRISH